MNNYFKITKYSSKEYFGWNNQPSKHQKTSFELSLGKLDITFSFAILHNCDTELFYEDHVDWIREAYGLPVWRGF